MSMRARIPRLLLLAAVLAVTAGCGFHLRGSGGPTFAKGILLQGIGTSNALYGDFNTALRLVGGRLVKSPAEAAGIVHVYRAYHSRRSLTLSRFGRSTEFDLFYRIVYDVRTPEGEVLLPRQDIEVRRDYFNDQTLPLAQVAEEGVMRTEMQQEAAQTLLRRAISALNKPPPGKS
jgi:LPS-assembly lipoprotein